MANNRLSADCPKDLQGKEKGGFVGGFDDIWDGFLQFFMAFYMPEIKHFPHLDFKCIGKIYRY